MSNIARSHFPAMASEPEGGVPSAGSNIQRRCACGSGKTFQCCCHVLRICQDVRFAVAITLSIKLRRRGRLLRIKLRFTHA